jgi:hypothetical protein
MFKIAGKLILNTILMVKKHFTLRLTAVSCLTFLSLFLASFSCQDHEVPEEEREFPVIHTLDIARVNDDPTFSYSVRFQSLGNQQIAEYGVVTYAGAANENINPTVPVMDNVKGKKYPFTGAGYMPPNLDKKSLSAKYEGPDGIIRLFYRAYAMLENNYVVYGDVKFVDFTAQGPIGNILPEIETAGGSNNTVLDAAIEFKNLGNMPIAEYGIVYLSNTLAPGNYVPTLANQKYKFDDPIENNYCSESLSFTSTLNTPANRSFYFRAYVLLENGDVVYGDTEFTYSN